MGTVVESENTNAMIEKVLKKATILPKNLRCGEYNFGIPVNPCQHPKFDENIHNVLVMLDTLYRTCGGVIFLTTEGKNMVHTELVRLFGVRFIDMIEKRTGLPLKLFSFIELSFKFESQTSWGALIVPSTDKRDPIGTHAGFCVGIDGDIQSLNEQISAEDGSAAVSHPTESQRFPCSSKPDMSPPEDVHKTGDSNSDTVPDASSNPSDTDKSLPEDVPETDDSDSCHPLTKAERFCRKFGNFFHHYLTLCVEYFVRNYVSRVQKHSLPKKDTNNVMDVQKHSLPKKDTNNVMVPDASSNPSDADKSLLEVVPKTDDSDTNNVMDYSSYTKLDWTNNKKDWKKHVITKDVETQAILTSCDMLKPAVPMRVTPKRDHLQYMFPCDGDMERVLAACEIHNVQQFAIACKSWWPIVSKHQADLDLRPKCHICDILTVSEDGRMHFWVIIADKDDYNFLPAMEYLMTTGRMIKYQLIQHGAPQMYVQCSLFSLGETGQMLQEEESEKMQNYLHLFYYKDKFDFSTLQQALAKVILSRESPLTRCASEQNSIWLSAMQAMALMNRAKVNYISGAAGCRKSWIAAELYRLHGAKDSVYICTTGPFLEFLRFNGYRGTLIQCDNDLIKEISDGNFQNKTCIIIDDSHNFSCSRSCMEELFQLLKKKRDMALFVFADNDYQAFDRDRQQTMYDCVHDLTRQEHLGLNSTNLTDVYRNTRKVVSFIQSAVEDIADSHYRIQCTHIDDGDGVECIKIANVLADTPENGLVKYLQTLLQDYEPSAIAVFLDKSQQTIFQCRSLLAKQMANTTFQSADDFPRRGIIVDSVDSFLGLDAAVCIFILPSASREIEPEQTLANPRYRVFLASRATHKAVFVVPEIDADLVERMKFDQFYVSIS